jgi:protease I
MSEKNVVVMSDTVGRFHGIMGVNMESHTTVEDLKDNQKYKDYLENFDILVLPGGVKALEKLRQEDSVIKFIYDWNQNKKIIASTCHGAQLMISANILKGKKATGYYSIKDDINNAGATYVNEPVVIDQNIVSSPHYNYMGEWMKAAIDLIKR